VLNQRGCLRRGDQRKEEYEQEQSCVPHGRL
jgi:hypothetical protein